VREILAAAAQQQDDRFQRDEALLSVELNVKVKETVEILGALRRSFGDDEK
jgi:hypothetical protein